MNETIYDIVRKMREELNQSWYDIDREKVHDFPDRIEKAAKWTIEGLNGGIVERDKYIAKLTNENERLKAALQPVLDIVMDSVTSDLSMELAISESKRIYKESMK